MIKTTNKKERIAATVELVPGDHVVTVRGVGKCSNQRAIILDVKRMSCLIRFYNDEFRDRWVRRREVYKAPVGSEDVKNQTKV